MTKKPTYRQIEILDFIARHIKVEGWSPTYKEIGEHFGFCASAASNHIMSMQRKGLLHRQPNGYRCIRVTDKGHQAIDGYNKINQALPG